MMVMKEQSQHYVILPAGDNIAHQNKNPHQQALKKVFILLNLNKKQKPTVVTIVTVDYCASKIVSV